MCLGTVAKFVEQAPTDVNEHNRMRILPLFTQRREWLPPFVRGGDYVATLRCRARITCTKCTLSLLFVCLWFLSSITNSHAQTEAPRSTGVGSCAAAGCHGGDGSRKRVDGTFDFSSASYSTWSQRDPHARAYEVLLNEQSQQMIRKLGSESPAAHLNRRCLVCHSPLEPTADGKLSTNHKLDPIPSAQQELLQDGVSCEACHGQAEKWLGPHTERTWRAGKSAADRAALGFVDLRFNLTERAQTCAKCHVGGPGRDVDHDLIAAGHPRLNFELSAYHANLPAHWSVTDDQRAFPIKDQPQGSALEARLWVIGQLTSADAALNLLETRAKAVSDDDHSAPWPEFAEYGCFACHHDLQAPSWRQQKPVAGRKPGSYPWGTWSYPLLGMIDRTEGEAPLSKALGQLELTMSHPAPKVAEVLPQTKVVRELLAAELVRHTTPESLTANRIRQLLQRVTQEGQQLSGRDWDAAAQVYLATVALYQARLQAEGEFLRLKSPNDTDRQLLTSLVTLRDKLKFPQPPETTAQYSSPRDFNAQRIEVIHEQLRKIEELVKSP